MRVQVWAGWMAMVHQFLIAVFRRDANDSRRRLDDGGACGRAADVACVFAHTCLRLEHGRRARGCGRRGLCAGERGLARARDARFRGGEGHGDAKSVGCGPTDATRMRRMGVGGETPAKVRQVRRVELGGQNYDSARRSYVGRKADSIHTPGLVFDPHGDGPDPRHAAAQQMARKKYIHDLYTVYRHVLDSDLAWQVSCQRRRDEGSNNDLLGIPLSTALVSTVSSEGTRARTTLFL
jgi:hypothetical protein